MNREEAIALGRRAQAASPGLLDCCGVRVWVRVKDHPCEPASAAQHRWFIVKRQLRDLLDEFRFMGMSREEHDVVLDVSHFGSQGWMLFMVRAKHEAPFARPTPIGGDYDDDLSQEIDTHAEDLHLWRIWLPHPDSSAALQAAEGGTEAECLVAALEAP